MLQGRVILISLYLASLLFAAPSWAEPDAHCLKALLKKDLTDGTPSLRSHFTHTSVWADRERIAGPVNWSGPSIRREKALSPAWERYIAERFGVLEAAFSEDLEQWQEFNGRIVGASRGIPSELAELQIAEKYLRDPEVLRVEFIPVPQERPIKTPDLLVYFRRGGAKIVEVKLLVQWQDLPALLQKADAQLKSYKSNYSHLAALRSDLELIDVRSGVESLAQERLAQLKLLAEQAFAPTRHLTRMTIHQENRPLLRVTHAQEERGWGVQSHFLTAPDSE